MKKLHKFLLLLVVLAAGAGIILLQGHIGTINFFTEKKSGEGGEATRDLITFDLLDEARTIDLIEMTLGFPETLRELDGRRVRLVGFMAPFDSLNDMRNCMILPSYVGCTFCNSPDITQVVYVAQSDQADERYPFIEEPSEVTGIFRLPKTDDPQGNHEGHEQGFVYVIEDALVTPYQASDAPTRAPGHEGGSHPVKNDVMEEISLDALVTDVSQLRGLAPLKPIRWGRISASNLAAKVRSEVEQSYPEEEREVLVAAFSLLGFFGDEAPALIDLLAMMNLVRRVAFVEEGGESISLLESASTKDPFTRLALVKEIADALARQHFASAQPPKPLHTDSNRALEALRQGNRLLVAYRYARQENISPSPRAPKGLFAGFPEPRMIPAMLDLWQRLPWHTGPFFAEARGGSTKELGHIDGLFRNPPSTTRELFRPSLYDTPNEFEAIPSGFAETLFPTLPDFVGSLGLGGLIPWLAGSHSIDQSKIATGYVLADRFALWSFPGGESALTIETRWPDRGTALQFMDSVPAHPYQILTDTSTPPYSVRIYRADSQETLTRFRAGIAREEDSAGQ